MKTTRKDTTAKRHIQSAKEAASPAHPLVGAGLHCKDDSGCVINQATIVTVVPSGNATVGDLALIQYFEWFGGDPSTRRLYRWPSWRVATGGYSIHQLIK
jgi:hypothetical protein